MPTSRIPVLEIARLALVTGVLSLGAMVLAPSDTSACPNREDGAACACAAGACPMMQGACGQAGGCAGAASGEPASACACPLGQGGSCACGADCPSKSGGTCPHGAVEKKPAGCGCGGAGAAAPAGDGGEAPELRAYVDPETGQLTSAPADDEDAQRVAAAAAQAAPAADAKQMAVPGAGVIAAFPTAKASRAVATLDGSGAAQAGCEHAGE